MQHPSWDLLEMRRNYAMDQVGISENLEAAIVNSLDEQYLIIMVELYGIMNPQSRTE